MKNIKLYSAVTIVLSAVLYTQLAVAAPMTAPAKTLYLSPLASLHLGDKGDDEGEDEKHDQCPLIFPFCEAF